MMQYPVDHTSASQLDQFWTCGEQFRRRYVLGHKIPPGIAACTGSAVHKAAEVNWKAKLTSGEDEPLSVLTDAAAEAYDAKVRDEGVFVPEDERPSAPLMLLEGKEQAVALVKPLREDLAPQMRPALVEQRIELARPELPVPILGFVDLYTEDKRLSDIKTSARAWSAQKVLAATQPTLYREMIRQLTGEVPARITIDQLVKTKVPKYEVAEADRTDADTEVLIERFRLMAQTVNAGIFAPADPEHWKCQPKFCGFYWTCKYIPAHRRILPKRSV